MQLLNEIKKIWSQFKEEISKETVMEYVFISIALLVSTAFIAMPNSAAFSAAMTTENILIIATPMGLWGLSILIWGYITFKKSSKLTSIPNAIIFGTVISGEGFYAAISCFILIAIVILHLIFRLCFKRKNKEVKHE